MVVHLHDLSRYSDLKVAQKEDRSFSVVEDDISDVYPIQLRLTVMREANSLAVRVCKKVCAGFFIGLDLFLAIHGHEYIFYDYFFH